MALKFIRLPSPFNGMDLFSSTKGDWTFVISEDRDHEPGVHRASVKPVGAVPFDDKRSDLGAFSSFTAASSACNDFYRHEEN